MSHENSDNRTVREDNPAGELELTPEDLEAVAGGADFTTETNMNICPPPDTSDPVVCK